MPILGTYNDAGLCWSQGIQEQGMEVLPGPHFRGYMAADSMQALREVDIQALNREDLIEDCPFKLRKLCRIINQISCNTA